MISGFSRQEFIKNLAMFLAQNSFNSLEEMETKQLRRKLLKINGIGEETADSILVYTFKRPIFIVDRYTRIFFSRMGICRYDATNKMIKQFVSSYFPLRHEIYNEFHALIVEHVRLVCKPKDPICARCVLEKKCQKLIR